ncbi:FAD-dependent oxidoreductase [Mucilaginibacter ginkgonis]|uniref:FAD-dependent oxidoreductase n=1 Tax=Mucilaginibacter ginkgonis TaxID=2682091 RepID=A0A6I4I3P6_9SPHI|nr:FAD-dependent oxidoreductase [Mucilaginibacter ginkgonis]QQL49148.1 FAD-dependent oxidoreductase [Mucilaginibacter ginkgonis]
MKNLKEEQVTPHDGQQTSPWDLTPLQIKEHALNIQSQVFDVIVIGGGITGTTTALLLQESGKKVLIVDAYQPGFGTTGGTSAHINTFADTTYKEAADAFGNDGAKLFAEAVNEGYDLIKNLIDKYSIECDYAEKTGYLYAEDDDQAKQLEDVFNGMNDVGVDAGYIDKVPTPVPYQKALLIPGQAQFHPVKYLDGLLNAFQKAGGVLLNGTMVDGLEKSDNGLVVKAGEVEFKAAKVVYATHIPPKITSYSFRCAPYRSYVLAVKLKSRTYPDALIYDLQEPYHYFRTHEIDGEQLLLVGGNDHKTGHDDPEKAFADLEKYTRNYYNVSSVKYKWSSQYYIPADGLPYIGEMSEAPEGVYCATGYNGNGMMLGSIAARIISDLIVIGESKYQEIFSPGRIKPIAGITDFIKENADVALHFITDRFKIKDTDSLKRIRNGSGKVVELDGEKIAAYRDDTGTLHCLNPVCTHAKCIVDWNAAEKSWDCPCHGARFDIDGKVLTGPADRDLEKLEI